MALALYPWQEELAQELSDLRRAMPNGVLVTGARGTGVFELVHAFAQSLLCQNPNPDGSACGNCKGCHLIRAGNHPDIQYLLSEAEATARSLPYTPAEGASGERKNLSRDILIHQPRALASFLALTSHQGGMRLVLVYPADQLRAEAAASLLKMLEEPPERTTFLLVADELDRVLPTIRSRCRMIRARMPSRAESLAWLATQKVKNPEEALSMAGGKPLAVFETDAKRMIDEDDREAILDVLRRGADADEGDVVKAVSRTVSLPAATELLSRWAWDLACVQNGAEPRYFTSYAADLKRIAQAVRAQRLYPWINAVRDARRVADHPLSARLIVEQLLFAYLRALR